ncbi:hypothetical protein AB0E08_04975 [Streptomyces sp. NPDC048281]|uniref:hypothetical protein n=1 Tax=Streptomyces sp. NPDC048281 TaxID=3154715 RepID=UPI00343B7C0C
MAEGRSYSRGEWISAGVFVVVVLAIAASCMPGGSDDGGSDSGAGVVSESPASRSADTGNGDGGLPVTAARFAEWPFTVDAGVLECEGGAVTFEPPGGPRYAVNGTAKDAGYPSVMPIWADDKTLGNGLKVDISEVLNKGLSLC